MLTRREQMIVRYTMLMALNGNDGRIAANTYYTEFTKEELASIRKTVAESKPERRAA